MTAPLDERIKRVVGRDAKSESQVSAVIKAQFSDDKNAKKADFLIDNQDLTKTLLKIKEIHNILIK